MKKAMFSKKIDRSYSVPVLSVSEKIPKNCWNRETLSRGYLAHIFDKQVLEVIIDSMLEDEEYCCSSNNDASERCCDAEEGEKNTQQSYPSTSSLFLVSGSNNFENN